MVYSLKELSEKMGVTKMTVLNHAKRLDIELEKKDNALVITNEQALKIGESINNQKPLDEKLNLETIFDVINQEIENNNDDQKEIKDRELQSDIVKLLKQQLEDKEKQISFLENQMNVKDNQINKLNETLDNQQKLLHNQQSLALQSNEKIEKLEDKLSLINNLKNENQNKEEPSTNISINENKVDDFYQDLKENNEKDNKGFFSKWFK
ncbi:DUF536 domain-containing protein [Macrococcoides caseolyticum]|uniref:DUF536 domain-containing protein n=1 Tax=Macrococcoides caseolyticum TaxID=69966 RepID=UPI000C31C5EE|nr:DUF536 domain-containing protein [Macrococcus caseolyticus]PKE16185.1 hypothetical protein CW718_11045 [Macrococcus caseolyticus]PKF05311.1 hypothetical protein CW698_10660 [Macrococcus caseolyticus]PKF28879.1 hypothetical protein CW697_11100 [Macrococcus caseolyticus]PNZ73737.1 hypothetical protein CD152_04180 [Macrococcus caseolyticus]